MENLRPEPGSFGAKYVEAGLAAAAEPFHGITTGGEPVPGLFPIQRSGVSTAPIRAAAEAFLDALDGRRADVLFPIDAAEWRMWSNIHRALLRHGVALADMSPRQQARAYDLLRASLSLPGFETARDIMRLNQTLAELTDDPEQYGEGHYWLSIMGQPSDGDPWGWQIDGHHLILNYFVLADQVVMTPAFMGSEVVSAEGGKYAGTRVLEAEERDGLTLARSLSDDQRRSAILSPELPPEVFTTAFRDNFELRYEGIRFGDLAGEQQRLLLDLAALYAGRLPQGHAACRLDEIRAHLADTHFAWMGGLDDDSVFYYRVHSPVLLIEFDHQKGVALPTDKPTRRHVHTVVRTPNGNDYGKDLLRQHHQQHAHSRS